jgi:hypothetical protein
VALIGSVARKIDRRARVGALLAVDEMEEGSEHRAGPSAAGAERAAARIVA